MPKKSSAAPQNRKLVEEIVSIARAAQARSSVSGGSKPHVTITKQVPELTESDMRPMLSAIEYAARGPFSRGRESTAFTEWVLKSQHAFVSVRFTKA